MTCSYSDPAGAIDAIASWLLQPGPALFSGLAGLMLVTFYVGLTHAGDRDEEPSIRFTGGLLAVLSLGALGTGIYALLHQ